MKATTTSSELRLDWLLSVHSYSPASGSRRHVVHDFKNIDFQSFCRPSKSVHVAAAACPFRALQVGPGLILGPQEVQKTHQGPDHFKARSPQRFAVVVVQPKKGIAAKRDGHLVVTHDTRKRPSRETLRFTRWNALSRKTWVPKVKRHTCFLWFCNAVPLDH